MLAVTDFSARGDNGRLTDSKGRIVNFRNTVIIMTSNIGAQHIEKMEKLGFAKGFLDEADPTRAMADALKLGRLTALTREEFETLIIGARGVSS